MHFPGFTEIKLRQVLVLSSAIYYLDRPDIIVGLITTQIKGLRIIDYTIQNWHSVGLRVIPILYYFVAVLMLVVIFVRYTTHLLITNNEIQDNSNY